MRKVGIGIERSLEPRVATRHSHWRSAAFAAMSQSHAKLGDLEAKQNLRNLRKMRRRRQGRPLDRV